MVVLMILCSCKPKFLQGVIFPDAWFASESADFAMRSS